VEELSVNYKSVFTSLTLITLCAVALLAAFLLWPRATGFDNTGKIDRQRFPEGEEVQQKWRLAPGAYVRVKDIAGHLTIETHDSDVAEVYAERAARRRAVLSELQLVVTHQPAAAGEPDSLMLSNPVWLAQKSRFPRPLRRLGFGQTPGFRERVVLKLPRQVHLLLSEISGDIAIGEVDGVVRVINTEGRVAIAKASEVRQLLNIKGSVEATLTRLGNGLQVGGIGGPVKLHFLQEPDARINGNLVLGPIKAELPGFTLSDKRFFRFRGQTGNGEKLILLNNILGSVTLDYVSEPQLAKTPPSR
jgi:hypothetical protein